jgi:hypothetical protein
MDKVQLKGCFKSPVGTEIDIKIEGLGVKDRLTNYSDVSS